MQFICNVLSDDGFLSDDDRSCFGDGSEGIDDETDLFRSEFSIVGFEDLEIDALIDLVAGENGASGTTDENNLGETLFVVLLHFFEFKLV